MFETKKITIEIEIPDSEASLNIIGNNIFQYKPKKTINVEVLKPLFENDGITPILGEDGKQVNGTFIELQEVENCSIEEFVEDRFKEIFEGIIKDYYVKAVSIDAQNRISQIKLIK